MRMPRILARYAVREALVYSSLGLLGVGGILLTFNLLRQISDVAQVGLGVGDLLSLVACLLGIFAPYALPVAFLFGVVATVSRLSADAEILAMRALGVSVAQLMVPFLLLALLTSGMTAVLLNVVEPSSRRELRSVAADIAARGGLIRPGRFRRLDRGGERLLLVEERADDGTLDGVFLTDRTDPTRPFTVVAAKGRFAFDREQSVARIELENGDIHFGRGEGNGGHDLDEERHIAFGTFTYAWDMSGFLGSGLQQVKARELDSSKLREVLRHFDEHGEAPSWTRMKPRPVYELQLQRRYALSVAPLLFAALGLTLGLRRSRGAGSWGAIVCALLVFAYYALLTLGTDLAGEGSVPVIVGLWLPNAVFAAVAVGLLARARRQEL